MTNKQYRAKNLEHCREYDRRYVRKNSYERGVLNNHRKRAKQYGCEGRLYMRQWQELKEFYRFTCLACGKQEPEIKLTLDHVIPLFDGGRNSIENIQPLCTTCNRRKWVRHTDYRTKESE